jgi:hypothetical protein
MIKELIRGLKWLGAAIGVLILLIGLWLGCAWSLGWAFSHFFNWAAFGPSKYISFGSCALVFTVIIQILTLLLVGWVLVAYGRAHGLPGMKMKGMPSKDE